MDHAQVVTTLQEHVLKPYARHDFPAEPWRSLPEIPSAAEIMGLHDYDDLGDDDDDSLDELSVSQQVRQSLPVNLVDRRWKDSASYIGAHYQLLREDSVYPLRQAVADVKANPSMKDSGSTAIYTHVHITGLTTSTQGPAVKIQFSYENAGKRIRWEQSERLQQGTIVALTPRWDMFKDICRVAVVAARPIKNGLEKNPPEIDLFWADSEDAEFDPTTNWVMVESRSGYWESFRHMGVALQKLRSEKFPMSKYLVDLQKLIDAPSHIKTNPYTNMTSVTANSPRKMHEGEQEYSAFENVNVLESWPAMTSDLDASQLEATKRILTKQIAIIQGPPGTGKTFVSITSLKIMLNNWGPGDPPIIISAQTNHALDQLLLLIEPHEPSFIRLGGRTSDGTGVIKKRTLYEVRQSLTGEALRAVGKVNANSRSCQHALEATQMVMVGHLAPLINDEVLTGLGLRDLKLITQEQFDSLHDSSWITTHHEKGIPQSDICSWVGIDQMCRLESKCPPINTTFEEEELEDQFEKLNEAEAEVGRSSDDIETLRGEYWPFKQTWTGQRAPKWTGSRIKKLLASTPDLWEIPDEVRGEFYCYFQAETKKIIRRYYRNDNHDYMRCVSSKKVAKWEADAVMVNALNTKIIGCTTTGLSKYRGLIAALKPRTLLIEEAAETVEGTVLAAMFESLDQLVLVGDHKQLQAHTNRSDLANHPYNLAVSLFERLVNNKLEYTMLNQQRRMVPEIRRVFTHMYPKLTDHPSVEDRVVSRPPVQGMASSCRWFHHVWPESKMDTSRCNHDEADMIVKVFDHLVLNDNDASKITILTFYNGQKKLLLKKLRKNPNLQHIDYFNVFTVDSYQGEENDIILLSLVRSNDYQESGFLSNSNRAVVALSRARRGLYLFGNVLQLLPNEKEQVFRVWGPISQVFQKDDTLSDSLPLTCQNHGSTVFVKAAQDFDLMQINGGCRKKCDECLPCGHKCPHSCHPFEHERIICKQTCEETLVCGHPCNENCGDTCLCMICGQPSEEEDFAYVQDTVSTEWTAPAHFKHSIKQALIRLPLPRPPQLPTALHHPGILAGNEGQAYSSTPMQWAASAKKPNTLIQANAVAVKTGSLEAAVSKFRTATITDVFKQVTVDPVTGRSAPGKGIKKIIPGYKAAGAPSLTQPKPVASAAGVLVKKQIASAAGVLVKKEVLEYSPPTTRDQSPAPSVLVSPATTEILAKQLRAIGGSFHHTIFPRPTSPTDEEYTAGNLSPSRNVKRQPGQPRSGSLLDGDNVPDLIQDYGLTPSSPLSTISKHSDSLSAIADLQFSLTVDKEVPTVVTVDEGEDLLIFD